MEPGFNCSELCDGSSSFGSQEQHRRALQELCTVSVVRTEAGGSAPGHEVCSAEVNLGGGMEKGGRGAQPPSNPGPARGCTLSPPGMASKTSPAQMTPSS